MKRLLMLFPLIFLCCLGCQQGEEVTASDVEADIQAITDIVAEWEAAYNNADLDRLVSFYADDAIAILPIGPPLIGKEAIQKSAQKMFEEKPSQEKDVVQDVQISGNLAVAHVTSFPSTMPKPAGEPFNAKGNFILVFKKESDGAWKLIYESLVLLPRQTE
jgi:uncharacterized protein (TIGR02246 family)